MQFIKFQAVNTIVINGTTVVDDSVSGTATGSGPFLGGSWSLFSSWRNY